MVMRKKKKNIDPDELEGVDKERYIVMTEMSDTLYAYDHMGKMGDSFNSVPQFNASQAKFNLLRKLKEAENGKPLSQEDAQSLQLMYQQVPVDERTQMVFDVGSKMVMGHDDVTGVNQVGDALIMVDSEQTKVDHSQKMIKAREENKMRIDNDLAAKEPQKPNRPKPSANMGADLADALIDTHSWGDLVKLAKQELKDGLSKDVSEHQDMTMNQMNSVLNLARKGLTVAQSKREVEDIKQNDVKRIEPELEF